MDMKATSTPIDSICAETQMDNCKESTVNLPVKLTTELDKKEKLKQQTLDSMVNFMSPMGLQTNEQVQQQKKENLFHQYK